MKAYLQTYILLIVSLFLISCEDFFETEIELDIPAFDSQLVLGASFDHVKEKQEISFTRTVGINQDPYNVDMGQAELWMEYGDEERVDFFHQGSTTGNVFMPISQITFLPNVDYKILGYLPGFDTLSAIATLPDEVPLNTVTYQYNAGVDLGGSERSGIVVKFNDPEGISNYYKVGLRIVYANSGTFFPTYLSSHDPSVSESGENNFVLIEDSTFDGKEKSITLQFFRYNEEEIDQISLEWTTINQEQYLYDKTLRQFELNEDNPFAAPTEIEGNVKNGLGFFGIGNTTIYEIEK